MNKGTVFNIQKFSLHDGPGIRTTVFLKGCPLNCWWCHNPESKALARQVTFTKKLCIGCKSCLSICEYNAIDLSRENSIFDRGKCKRCGSCSEICPTNAIKLLGKEMTVTEVVNEIEKDRVFYEESGGGVTFSGGEPLMQHDFLYQLLSKCKQKDLHTALDTSGFTDWNILEKAAKLTDLFLYDIKHMANEKHIEFTGVSNAPILSNLQKLAHVHSNIQIRLPIIPGINDDEENIVATGEFISAIGLRNVSILAYHYTGVDKYERIEEAYKLPNTLEPTHDEMQRIARILEAFRLIVRIGG